MNSVSDVKTDMNAHTVHVTFDDEKLAVDEVVAALGEAGYAVPGYEQVN